METVVEGRMRGGDGGGGRMRGGDGGGGENEGWRRWWKGE